MQTPVGQRPWAATNFYGEQNCVKPEWRHWRKLAKVLRPNSYFVWKNSLGEFFRWRALWSENRCDASSRRSWVRILSIRILLQRVDDEVVLVVEAVPPDVEGRPVAEVEEDEQEREHDQKDQVRPAVVVRRRASNWAVLAAAVLAAAAAVSLVLHLAGVPFPAAPKHFRFRSGLDERDRWRHFRRRRHSAEWRCRQNGWRSSGKEMGCPHFEAKFWNAYVATNKCYWSPLKLSSRPLVLWLCLQPGYSKRN